MVAVYALTSILSAFLVFFIQPVVAKIALPTLGGTPVVWNGCMLFFQAALLGGYLYANVLSNRVRLQFQPFIHIALLLLALLVFPMQFEGVEGVVPATHPLLWLMGMLLFSVGVPFFVISATAPLLQRWFSHTNHPDAANPYFLYAASNIGSMGALLCYPFLIEPFYALISQVRSWETGVTVLALLFIPVAWFLLSHIKRQVFVEPAYDATMKVAAPAPVTWKQRGSWVVYSAVPASLLYGVTAYLTTDIAPVPFLWVLPLALYLLTFILVFSTRPRGGDLAQQIHPVAVGMLCMFMVLPFTGVQILAIHLAVYVVVVLSVHTQLSRSKPEARHLTEFFLWMSLGGVLGGAFNTLVAPHVFNSVVEYPLALLLSCLLLPNTSALWLQVRRYGRLIAVCVAVVAIAYVVLPWVGQMIAPHTKNIEGFGMQLASGLVIGQAVLLCIVLVRYRLQAVALVSCLAAMFVLMHLAAPLTTNAEKLLKDRSVFAVYIVEYKREANANFLVQGSTTHGVQSRDPEERLVAQGYYWQIAPLVQAMTGREGRVALVGLGAGALICAGREGDVYDIYEIDPLIYRIASDEKYFSYLADCPPQKQVLLGDGRMKIAEQPDDFYNLIVLDAFNSDAVPLHLLTQQAVESYRSKLKAGGSMLFNVSNRYIDLLPALSTIAHAEGLQAYTRFLPSDGGEMHFASQWVVLTGNDEISGMLAEKEWKHLSINEPRYLWTDSYSNIFTSLIVVREWLFAESDETE